MQTRTNSMQNPHRRQKVASQEELLLALSRIMPTASVEFHRKMEATLYNYFEVEGHDVDAEGPILLVEMLPELMTAKVDFAPKAEDREGAVLFALGDCADDLGEAGVCFRFQSHGQMNAARTMLKDSADIAWAFASPDPSLPMISTRLITHYSHQTGLLMDDYCPFFEP